MPCRGGEDACVGESASTVAKIDKLTRMLCNSLGKLEKTSVRAIRELSLETQEWWAEHKEQDRLRLDAEERERINIQAKVHALKKLTQKERELLGL